MHTNSIVYFICHHMHSLGVKLLEHIVIAFTATIIAIVIGVPIGIWISIHQKLRHFILGITNIFQTIPSLALLAFLIPLLGIGIKPTVITLAIYALLPIIRNTYSGLCSISPDYLEAANGLGFTNWQRLIYVELPLAMPIIISGIRTATAITIGITTIAAFIGAGGLGDFIIEGLSLDSTRLILLGAIPVALLALITDWLISYLEKTLSQRKIHYRIKYLKLGIALSVPFTILFIWANISISSKLFDKNNSIVIATKNFSEQYVLGNLMAEMIQAHTHLHVIKKFNLGTTTILQNALMKGEVDVYPEYTGTAYMVILKQNKIMNKATTYTYVKKAYQDKFHLVWLSPFGFNNSQTLAVTKSFAKKHHLKTLADLQLLSNQLSLAAPPEFIKRPDGFLVLSKAYGLQFKRIIQIQPDLMYRAIENNDIQIIEVFTTDGRIFSYHLQPLIDNRNAYPPYDAAPVIRFETLKAHPEIKTVLNLLSQKIDNKTMVHLNYLVAVKHASPEKVAHDFLMQQGLLRK